MILTDTGPLVALIDADEAAHRLCATTLSRLARPLVTTWPVIAEAMYLVGRVGGWPAQEALWQLIEAGELEIAQLDGQAQRRMHGLMEQYRDRPMDLADASLVALAEQRRLAEVFTLDAEHFRSYRPHGRGHFAVIP